VNALTNHLEQGTGPWFLSSLTRDQLAQLLAHTSWTNNVKEMIERAVPRDSIRKL